MLKKMLNEAAITFQIEATGPILIKDGESGESGNILKFVVDANQEIFIPGSSIKGVWRSWCEKIARTISEDNSPLSCDPFDGQITSRHLSCSKRLERKNPYLFSWDKVPGDEEKKLLSFLKDIYHIDWIESAKISKSDDHRTIMIINDEKSVKIMVDADEKKATLKISDEINQKLKIIKENNNLNIQDPTTIYALSCPICKLFGHTSLGSRIRISDAYLSDNGSKTGDNLRMRDGIGIDRFTGGVSAGPFKYQYVMGRTFTTEVQIRNFELWQLGLLAFLFRDFEEELVPVGFGKTRGLGRVKGTVESLKITYYGLNKPEVDKDTNRTEIPGVGNLYNDRDKDNYCFADELPLNDIEFTKYNEDNPIKLILTFDASQARSLFNRTAPYWAGGDGDSYYQKIQSIRKEIIQKKIDEGIDV